LIGIGRGANVSTLQIQYCRQPVSVDPSEDGLWIIPPFEAGPVAAGPAAGVTTSAGETKGETLPASVTGGPTAKPGIEDVRKAKKPTIHGISIAGSVPVENWAELFRCFIGPAARMQLKKLDLNVQFKMEARADTPLSPDDQALKAMREAAKQLGLKFEIDE
jgi:hypothetical protein